jgi:hypothetical protein
MFRIGKVDSLLALHRIMAPTLVVAAVVQNLTVLPVRCTVM